jgi:hypothetical protein
MLTGGFALCTIRLVKLTPGRKPKSKKDIIFDLFFYLIEPEINIDAK